MSIGYFSRFGVTERMIAETLSAALARGGDFAGGFFQHPLGAHLALEAGDGYTEELTSEALVAAAKTAAAIADGPSRPGPVELHLAAARPSRYPLVRPWEEVRPEEKLPLLVGIERRAFA